MNRKAILNTALCYWSDENDCYLVESPLYDKIAGSGDTRKEAMQVFRNMLDDVYEHYLAGTIDEHSRPGRPSKGTVSVSYRLKPEAKDEIANIAERFNISQGEAVHYLVLAFKSLENPGPRKTRNPR